MAGALDSPAYFTQLTEEVGLPTPALENLRKVGVRTCAAMAFCCSYTPGQSDDSALKEFMSSILDGGATVGEQAAFRRLFMHSHTLYIADMKSRLDSTDADQPRRIPTAERAERFRCSEEAPPRPVLRGRIGTVTSPLRCSHGSKGQECPVLHCSGIYAQAGNKNCAVLRSRSRSKLMLLATYQSTR